MKKIANGKSILQKKVLTWAGGVFCAALLVTVAIILTSCERAGKKILIAYETKHGSTTIYVNKMAKVLRKNGYRVDTGLFLDLLDTEVSSYSGVIIGSPNYWANPIPGTSAFIEKHKTALANMPVAYFLLSTQSVKWADGIDPLVFWYFPYSKLLNKYPEIFPLTPCPTPPFPFCKSVPYWIGLMPGRVNLRKTFPVEYIGLSFTGYKEDDLVDEEIGGKWVQKLIDYRFFEGEPNIPPTLTINAEPVSGVQPLTVQFHADINDPDGKIVSMTWDFGDGSSSFDEDPLHTFECHGKYWVVLRVVDDKGTEVDEYVEVNVLPDSKAILSYNCDIQPIFDNACTNCHGKENPKAGLSLESCEDLRASDMAKEWTLVNPGSRLTSLLYLQIRYGPLPFLGERTHGETTFDIDDIAKIGTWIDSLTDPECADNYCACPLSYPDELTNEEKAIALLKSFESLDPFAVSYINKKTYIQHNLSYPDGRETLMTALATGQMDNTTVDVVRSFTDGDYVITHTEYLWNGMTRQAAFDVFRFENGLIVEHWDNLQDYAVPNPSGHTMLDGPTGETDMDKTEENKKLVESFVNKILISKDFSGIGSYFNGENLIQHNPTTGDGLSAFINAISSFSYTTLHYVHGYGDFVLTMVEGEANGKHTAFYDLFRIESGYIAEHWDVLQVIPPESEWENDNGKF